MPSSLRTGISYGKRNNWMAGADFSYQNWSQFESFGVKDTLKNSFSIHAGGQKVSGGFVYRLGARYGKSYLELKQTRLEDYAVTLGFGIRRIAPKKPVSMIHFAVELGRRGTLRENLIEEDYIRFHVGFSLADVWFIKPKYD
jgi:hypothetical protein